MPDSYVRIPEDQRPEVLVVYSKPSCVQCTATMRAIEAKNIPHTVMDLTQDEALLQQMKELGYLQAPVVITPEGDHWAGFRPDKIAEESNRLNLVSA